LEVPWWLEWTPDEVMDWIVEKLVGFAEWVKSEILGAYGVDVEDVTVEVETVTPGKTYRVTVTYTVAGSPPLPVWAVATLILGLLAVVLWLLSPVLEKVERFVEVAPKWFLALVGVGGLLLLAEILKKR